MKDQPKVSMIMPLYNRAYMLRPVLDSLMGQTYKNIEIILVDDGSTDNTREVVKEYPGMIYLTRQNAGAAAARNTGIEKATGEIVFFIDSDVISPADLVETHVKYHLMNKKYIVQGQLIRIIDLKDALKEPYRMIHYSRSFFDGANVSVRKEHVDKAGGFDSEILRHGWDDLDYGMKLLALGLKPKRMTDEGYVWHYEGEYTKENVHKFFKKRYREGQLGVLFYRKHPKFSVKMMVMAHPFFYWLERRMYKEEYLLSDEFFGVLQKMIDEGKKPEAIMKARVNGYHFYLKGVQDKIKEDGYLLKK